MHVSWLVGGVGFWGRKETGAVNDPDRLRGGRSGLPDGFSATQIVCRRCCRPFDLSAWISGGGEEDRLPAGLGEGILPICGLGGLRRLASLSRLVSRCRGRDFDLLGSVLDLFFSALCRSGLSGSGGTEVQVTIGTGLGDVGDLADSMSGDVTGLSPEGGDLGFELDPGPERLSSVVILVYGEKEQQPLALKCGIINMQTF